MKKSQNTKSVAASGACCSRRQKIYGVIALGGLFACGLMVGLTINGGGNISVNETPVQYQNAAVLALNAEKPTCVVIEEALSGRLNNNPGDDWYQYLRNADIYASMVENGCPENADKYKAASLRALEIADALQYDNEVIDNAEIVIDTYKKLDMQNQAREFLNKVQKLTDPAIDFILKMEQIINE